MSSQPLTQKRLVTLVAGLFILVGLSWYRLSQPHSEAWVTIRGETMGTTYTVKIPAYLDGNIREYIETILEDVNARMSTYREDSELSRFNASDTEAFALSPELFSVLSNAIEISAQTQGAFDVTVGPIVNAYGFGPDLHIELPSVSELNELRDRVGFELLSLDVAASSVRKSNPDVYCDLSAIAKGYGVDAIAEIMDSLDFHSYFIEVGGEVRCKGLNPDGIAWRVGIEKPVENARAIHRVVSLHNVAMATSGSYRNYIDTGGQRVSHTIDPRTGRPVSHDVVSVSVIHESCQWADAYATALMVMGEQAGLVFAEKHGLSVLMLVREAEGELREVMSPEFEGYLNEAN